MVKGNVFLVLILVTVVTAGANAGTLKGKVSSMTKSGVCMWIALLARLPATTVPYQIDQHGQELWNRGSWSYRKARRWCSRTATRWRTMYAGQRFLATRAWHTTWALGRPATIASSASIGPVSFLCVQYACGDGWISSWCPHRITRTPRLPVITPCAIFRRALQRDRVA